MNSKSLIATEESSLCSGKNWERNGRIIPNSRKCKRGPYFLRKCPISSGSRCKFKELFHTLYISHIFCFVFCCVFFKAEPCAAEFVMKLEQP